MSLTLYGVIDGNGPIGFGGERIEAISYGPLAAVVGPAPQVDFFRLPREELVKLLLAHQQTLEQIMKRSFILPFKFGTSVTDEYEASQILKEGEPFLSELVGRMRDCTEINVVATWEVPKILREIAEEDSEIAARKKEIEQKNQARSAVGGDASPTHVGRLLAQALKRKADTWRQKIAGTLGSLAQAAVEHDLLNDEMILNGSFLIRRAAEEEFFRGVEEADTLFLGKLHFKCIGPLPPYSFATVTLKRFDPVKIEEAARILRLNGRAELSEVKRAYKELSRRCHPDTNPSFPLETFEKLHWAYELVADYCKDEPRSLGREAVSRCLTLELVQAEGTVNRAA